jgi:hypothetical protein
MQDRIRKLVAEKAKKTAARSFDDQVDPRKTSAALGFYYCE